MALRMQRRSEKFFTLSGKAGCLTLRAQLALRIFAVGQAGCLCWLRTKETVCAPNPRQFEPSSPSRDRATPPLDSRRIAGLGGGLGPILIRCRLVAQVPELSRCM